MDNVNLYYALGPNCYGIGKTKEQAIKYARENWPTWSGRRALKEYFSIWATDAPTIHVSEVDGSIQVTTPYRLEKIQTSTLARK